MCIAGGAIVGIAPEAARRDCAPSRASTRQVETHEHIYYEGDERDCLYVVESGWVKLYRTLLDGQRQIVGFANAGSILGLESDAEHTNGCEAITPVVVRSIPMSRVTDICLHDGKLASQLLRQVGRQLGAAQAQLAAVGTQSAEQKLANFLLTISDLCGNEQNGEFDMPMRRGDMAEFLGLRLETVSRKMSEFQRRGWIRMVSLYHCALLRRDILEDLAAGGSIEDSPMLRAV